MCDKNTAKIQNKQKYKLQTMQNEENTKYRKDKVTKTNADHGRFGDILSEEEEKIDKTKKIYISFLIWAI